MKRETYALRSDLHVRSEPALGSLANGVEGPGGIPEVFEYNEDVPTSGFQVPSTMETDSLLSKLL